MTPERAGEIATEFRRSHGLSSTADCPIRLAILQACAEERADVLKNEFICARCQLRYDSTREIKHEF